jgi:hypothetical protein
VISAKQYDTDTKIAKTEEKPSPPSQVLDNNIQSNQNEDTTDSKPTNHTEDDIYLNESTANVCKVGSELEDDIEVLHISNGTG